MITKPVQVFRVAAPRPRKISEFKPTFSNLAQTSHYQLSFGGLSFPLRQHLAIRGVDSRFIGETAGLLCSSAVIPGSSIGTADIAGNFMGVAEKMAHTRVFTQIDLEFYVDKDYKTMKFLEHWTEFISSGSGENPGRSGYYFRMQYPDDYKCDRTKIVKFDRDYKQSIEYTFFGMFPISLNSTPVSYGGSDILRATASFNYDRYVAGAVSSLDIARGSDNNKMITGLTGMLSSLGGDRESKIKQQQLESGQRKIVDPGSSGGIVKNFNKNGNQTGPVIIREVTK